MSLKQVREAIAESEEVAAGAPVTLRRDIGYDVVYYLKENAAALPRAPRSSASSSATTREGDRGRAPARHASARSAKKSSKEPQYKGLEPGDEIGHGRHRGHLRRRPARHAGGDQGPGQRRRAADPGRAADLDPAGTGGHPRRRRSTRAVQEAGEYALSSRGLPGAFVSMNIHTGEILGMGSYPTYDPPVFTEPVDPEGIRRTLQRPDPGAADQPRHRKRLPDRLDLQDHHRAGGAGKRRDHAADRRSTTTATSKSARTEIRKRRRRGQRPADAGPRPAGLLRRLLLQAGPEDVGQELPAELVAQARDRRARPGSTSAAKAEGLVPSKEWRDEAGREGGTEDTPLVGRRQRPARDRPGRPADQPAADGDRLRDARQRRQGRRRRTSAWQSRTPPAGSLEEFELAEPRRKVKIDPAYRQAIMEGLHEAAQARGGTATAVFGEFPIQIAGKTGTAERPSQTATSPGSSPCPRTLVPTSLRS